MFFKFTVSIIAQSNSGQNNFIDCLNKYYGQDDLLVNGFEYTITDPKIKNHPFYFTNKFEKGKVFIRGKVYSDVRINYNLVNDELILFLPPTEKSITINSKKVVLNSQLIDSFYIVGNHFPLGKNDLFSIFVNLRLLDNSQHGYVKKICRGVNLSVYEKFSKRYHKVFTDLNPFGVFSNSSKELFIYKGNDLFYVKSKKGLLKVFNKNRKKIKRFLKKNRIKFKKMNERDLITLFTFIEKIENSQYDK